MPGNIFIISYGGRDADKHSAGHVHVAFRMKGGEVLILDPSWSGNTQVPGKPRFHSFREYITSFVNGEAFERNGKTLAGKSPGRYFLDSVIAIEPQDNLAELLASFEKNDAFIS